MKTKITEEMVNKVGICSYETILRHAEYEHTTPLEKIIIDVNENKLPVLSTKNEGWKLYKENGWSGKFFIKDLWERFDLSDTIKNRRELYKVLANNDYGSMFLEGSYGLYEYISKLDKDWSNFGGDILIKNSNKEIKIKKYTN